MKLIKITSVNCIAMAGKQVVHHKFDSFSRGGKKATKSTSFSNHNQTSYQLTLAWCGTFFRFIR